MFSLYSKGCEYAILALAEINDEKIGQKFRAADVCRKVGIPEAYARKTFQSLVRIGFLKATPGPGGGYALVRDPGKTTVLHIIEAVEGKDYFKSCVLGFSSCNEKLPCALHHLWVGLKNKMLKELGSRTLAELSSFIRIDVRKSKKRSPV